MMQTLFLYLTVGVLIPLMARSIVPPPLPLTGVQLYGGYNKTSYPNNSMIPANRFHRDDPNNDGLNDALWCQSAKNESNIGVWYYPNGTQVSTVDDSSPLHSVHMSGQIGLYRDSGLGNLEGIYTCVIPDECNVNQTLIIAIYTLYAYQTNRGPNITETTFKSLLSTRDNSSFLISFNVTDGTATYINCTLNDTLIYPNITQIILSYQLPIKILVELLFQSRDEGWYNCSVSNSRVEDKQYNNVYPAQSSIYVKVAKKPLNVRAKWISSFDVLVTWSPPVNNNPLIDGYEVFYGVNDCDCKTFSVGVTNYTELVISGLCNNQNYSFFVVSYSNEEHTLPSEWSDVITLIAVNEVTSSIGINGATCSSMNEITTFLKPSPSSQSNDCSCGENSSSSLIVGVGLLLFTNFITVVIFIISCLWLLRSRRKHKEFDKMIPQREDIGQYLSSRGDTAIESELKDKNLHFKDDNDKEDINLYPSHVYAVIDETNDDNIVKSELNDENLQLQDNSNEEDNTYAVVDEKEDGTAVESELNDENLQLQDNSNEEDDNPYALPVYAVVDKKKDRNGSKPAQSPQNILPPLYSNVSDVGKNDDEITYQDVITSM